MKVLFLVNTLDSSNGWGRFSRELITRFINAGIEATVLTEKASGFPGEKVVLGRSWRALLSALEVRKFIQSEKPDIIHSFEVNPYGISAELGRLGLNVRHVITATGAYSIRPLHMPSTSFLTKRAYVKANRVLCISKYIKEKINEKVSVPKSSVITLGVDNKKFSGEREKASVPFILSVGNLCYRKGYHVSVAAFAKVARIVPDIKYYIAGKIDKNTYEMCQKIVKKEHLEDRVVFLGSVNDDALRKLYLSAELFVLASVNEGMHFEGFGLVFLEAASAGLPVIGTTGNGIEDAILNRQNGFLVSQNDPEKTASAIIKILKDKDLKESFSKESIKWAQENTWENTIQKYLEVYQKVSHE
jgi:glycosyltransferase involved in cell wall biosynthesis